MNVLVYVMDALRADYLSCYGHETETSPNVDRFADDAVRYENAYSTATWTKPAATSLMTGRHPRSVNMLRLLDRLPDLEYTLPRRLSSAGFSTTAVSANNFVSEEFGFTGFDSFTHLQKNPTLQRERRTAEARGSEQRIMDRLGIDEIVTPLSADVNEELFEVFEGDDGEADRFVLAWSIDTHGPYFVRGGESAFGNDETDMILESEVERGNLEKTRSLYRDMIHYNDRQFGRLVEKLREEGLYDETMIILAADHGESFGDHEKILDMPIIGHTGPVYEEVVRVPLLIKYPGGEFGGRTVDGLAQLTDVYPTITDVCGIDTPDPVQGRSLRPPTGERLGDRTVFVESQPTKGNVYSGAVRRGDQKYVRLRKGFRLRRDWRRMAESVLWKLQMPGRQLFDLGTDPGEQTDVSDERPEVAAELDAAFREIRDRQRDAAAEAPDAALDEVAADTERNLKAMGYLE